MREHAPFDVRQFHTRAVVRLREDLGSAARLDRLPPDMTDDRALWDWNAQVMNLLFGEAYNAHRASIGLATYPHDAKTPHDIIRQADEMMYMVKNSTRDNIGIAQRGVVK